MDEFVDFCSAKTRTKGGKRRRKPKPKYDGVKCLPLAKLEAKKYDNQVTPADTTCGNYKYEVTIEDIYEVHLMGRLSNRTILPKVSLTGQFFFRSLSNRTILF